MQMFRIRPVLIGIFVLLAGSAVLSSSAGNAAAPSGRALALDGADDYATAADSPSLDLGTDGGDFTAETFFYVPDTTGNASQTVFWKQGAYGVYVLFHTGSQDRLIFRIWVNFTDYNFIYADRDLDAGWHHVAAVFDNEIAGGGDLMALYLDGGLVSDSTAFEWTPGIPNTTSVLHLGAYVGVNPFDGWLDEARLSDTVRYSGGSYSVPAAPFTADGNTAALWHFDEAAGATTFDDASGNGNALSGVNGAAAGDPPAGPTDSPTPTPGPPSKGDANCDGAVDEDDAIAILRYDADLGGDAVPQGVCAAIGAETGDGLHGDANCDGTVDARDALVVLLFKANVALDLPGGCAGP